MYEPIMPPREKKSFKIEAAVKCDFCSGRGCQDCQFRGFNREPVEFVVDESGKIIKVNVSY